MIVVPSTKINVITTELLKSYEVLKFSCLSAFLQLNIIYRVVKTCFE
jgi:hypothetical protein